MSLQRKPPSRAKEVLLIALQLVFGLIAGAAICAAWLIFKPVTIMDTPPAANRTVSDRHEVVYVRGKAASRGNQGARKQKAFRDRVPGEIVFVEEDVNGWLGATFGSKERTIPIQGIGMTFGPRVPVVRFVDDELEIGLEIGMDREGGARTIVAQARGGFVSRGGRQIFVPRKIYLGSCPLPWNLGGRQLYQKLIGLYAAPDNISIAWDAVSRAAVMENRLHVMMGAGETPAPAPAAVAPAPAEVPPAPVDPAPEAAATNPDVPAVAPAPAPATESTPAPATP
jgi:hypothetical protein